MPSRKAIISGYRALLLDRDGVINTDHGYVHLVKDFEFIDGIFSLLRAAHARDYKIVVVTNQAGIARGYYSEKQFHELTAWMCEKFAKQGVPIAGVYFSPFHPDKGLGDYKRDDVSRKPHPGMILRAQDELALDLGKSILIGDKATDMEAGIAAGVGTNLLLFPNFPDGLPANSVHCISTLGDAIPYLKDIPSKVVWR
jgi:D-glycero-D-manno-heptose 1,7-bisphosphate phosphatase